MGKRRNKKKSKSLRNAGSEKEACASFDQSTLNGKQTKQKNIKAVLPDNNKNGTGIKSKSYKSDVNNLLLLNQCLLSSHNRSEQTSYVTESKKVHEYKEINKNPDSSVKEHKGYFYGVPFYHSSESDDEYTSSDFYNPADIRDSSDFSIFSEMLNSSDSGTKEKQGEQKGIKIKKNSKVETSKKKENDPCRKLKSCKPEVKEVSVSVPEQVSQTLDVVKFTPARQGSSITESKNKHSEDEDAAIMNISEVKQTSSWKAICDRGIYENDFCGEFDISSESEHDYPSRVPNIYGARRKSHWEATYPNVYQYDFPGEFNSGSDDEYTHSDFPYDKYEDRRNFEQKRDPGRIESKENFLSSVNDYKNSKVSFVNIYHKWLAERRNTVEKLQMLYNEVRDGRLQYHETQAKFKTSTSDIRKAKSVADNMLASFFASAITLGIDAISGATAIAQVYSTDCFQSKFQEIMDHDAEITKDLYEVRSKCVAKYQGIEEVMRKFHSDTLGSTLNKISGTLEVSKYWEAMKRAYGNDDMPKLMDVVGSFFNNACQSQVLGEVCNSVETYVNDNPAVLDACKSTGKALYEATNTWAPLYTRRSLRGKIDTAANMYLALDDTIEANHHRTNDGQSKLESQIEDAIHLLQSEMEEICDTYKDLLEANT